MAYGSGDYIDALQYGIDKLEKKNAKLKKKNKKLEKQVKKLTFVILNTKEDQTDSLLSKHDKLRMKRKKK